jgi:hypothetical protein
MNVTNDTTADAVRERSFVVGGVSGVPRASGLALFDALGSHEKSLPANPGRHADVAVFEADSAERFFRRHLRPYSSGDPDQESR